MTERWWDPAGPAVDLLTPGGDQHLDTANALFALHRAGAAALNAAAATPLVDETVISKAADSARAAYAEPVVETLGEVLGDQTYAGLLVRDVADSAEAASLGVYRSCVSKGVPPPIAAQRAALVYGVPPNHLGSYQAVAANPVSKDIAVLDAADRVLFAWAATAAGNEIEQIAKRETPEQRREAVADQPRANRGRWGRRDLAATVDEARNPQSIAGMSVTDWINAQVAAPPVEVEEQREQPARQRRQVRRKRELRQVRQVRTTSTPVRAQQRKFKRATQRAAFQLDLGNRALVARDAEEALKQVQPKVRSARHGATSMTQPTGVASYPLLNDDVSLVMPFEEYRELEHAARREGQGPHDGQALFITADALHRPAPQGSFTGSDMHERLVDDLVDEFRGMTTYQNAEQPVVMELSNDVPAEISRAVNVEQRSMMIDDFKREYLRHFIQDNPEYSAGISNIEDEIAHVQYLPDYGSNQMLFVWVPPDPDRPGAARVRKQIADVTIKARNLRGEHDPGTKPGEDFVELDRSQLLRIDRSQTYFSSMSYDQDNAVFRIEVEAEVVDPFSKAEDRRTRRAASADQPRVHGLWGTRTEQAPTIAGQGVEEWVREQLAGASEAKREARVLRTKRTLRRQPAPAGQPLARAKLVPTRMTARHQRELRLTPLTRRQLELRAELPNESVAPFEEREAYVVVSNSDAERRLGIGSQAMVAGHSLGHKQKSWLRHARFDVGDDALEEVNRRTGTNEINPKLVLDNSYRADSAGEMRFLAAYQHAAARCATTAFTLSRYTQGDQLRIRVKVYDVTDYAEPTLHVMRWVNNDPDSDHVLNFKGIRRVLAPEHVNRQLSYEWHAAVQATHGPMVGGNIVNPILSWWDINDVEP